MWHNRIVHSQNKQVFQQYNTTMKKVIKETSAIIAVFLIVIIIAIFTANIESRNYNEEQQLDEEFKISCMLASIATHKNPTIQEKIGRDTIFTPSLTMLYDKADSIYMSKGNETSLVDWNTWSENQDPDGNTEFTINNISVNEKEKSAIVKIDITQYNSKIKKCLYLKKNFNDKWLIDDLTFGIDSNTTLRKYMATIHN